MARAISLGLRIATVKRPESIGLNIAAQIILALGTLLLDIVLLRIARRFFGQLHARYALTVKHFVDGVCIMIIPLVVMSTSKVNMHLRQALTI